MFVFAILSFVAGSVVYIVYIGLRYGQWVGSGDFGVALCCGLFSYATVAVPVWTGVMALARVELSYRAVPDHWRWIIHLALPPIVAILPTAGTTFILGGTPRAVLSPEGLSFLVLFTAAGATFGAGWHICYGARRWTRANERGDG